MGNELTVSADQSFWNEKQLAALKQMGVENASNADLAVFLHECQRTGLDPFLHQIYMINRKGKQTMQVGIDGLRLVARRAVDRSGETLSILEQAWRGKDGKWTDCWAEDDPPVAAKVVIQRGKGTFPAIALYKEYAAKKANGKLTQMWEQRPAGQLMKCAEALAYRMAFPQDLSGLHSEEEMEKANNSPSADDVVDAEIVDDGQKASMAQRQTISDLLGQAGVDSPDLAARVLRELLHRDDVNGTADLMDYDADAFLGSRELFVQRVRSLLQEWKTGGAPEESAPGQEAPKTEAGGAR